MKNFIRRIFFARSFRPAVCVGGAGAGAGVGGGGGGGAGAGAGAGGGAAAGGDFFLRLADLFFENIPPILAFSVLNAPLISFPRSPKNPPTFLTIELILP